MDEKKANAIVQTHINKSIDAKLMPLTEMVAGLHMALGAVIGALHEKGTLPVENTERALHGVLEGLNKQHKASQSAETLRRLITMCESLRRNGGPASLN